MGLNDAQGDFPLLGTAVFPPGYDAGDEPDRRDASAAWTAITIALAPAGSARALPRYGYLGGKQRVTSTGAGMIEDGRAAVRPRARQVPTD